MKKAVKQKHMRRMTVAGLLAAVLLFCQGNVPAAEKPVQMIPSVVRMQSQDTQEAEELPGLYSLSAVLMDAASGRVLYEKDGEATRSNASTTKVLTCILALEHCPGDDYVQVSANAAAQPEVKLGLRQGEQYFLEDLLYSLMLKSHNDSAVAIAEHVAGSVPAFARMMNEKAKAIGCTDTYFVTPNGLDAEDETGEHHTTARDLALIMRYAIQNQSFLRITQTRDYSFSDISGKRQYSMHNANALFDLMDGVISGKTGFTGNAGYCYVCAVKREDKTFIVALLGCGWPNNKGYKWKDTKALIDYGDANFAYENVWQEPEYPAILVKNAVPEGDAYGRTTYLSGSCTADEKLRQKRILLQKGEELVWKTTVTEELQAPIKKGSKLGKAVCYLNGEALFSCPIVAEKSVDRIDYSWYAQRVFHHYFH